jgi:transposase-like protein
MKIPQHTPEIESPAIRAEYFCIQFYLEFFNSYLTLQKMAEDHGISEATASHLYTEGKRLHHELY